MFVNQYVPEPSRPPEGPAELARDEAMGMEGIEQALIGLGMFVKLRGQDVVGYVENGGQPGQEFSPRYLSFTLMVYSGSKDHLGQNSGSRETNPSWFILCSPLF